MARELRIRERDQPVKIRNPWAVALLPFITLGIYHLVWWYRINRELRDYGRARGCDLGQRPGNSLLALFPGAILLVPPLISYWRGTLRIASAAEIRGTDPVNGWIALVLYLVFAPAFWAYLQVSLNSVWRSEAEASPELAGLPGSSEQLPPVRSGESYGWSELDPPAAR